MTTYAFPTKAAEIVDLSRCEDVVSIIGDNARRVNVAWASLQTLVTMALSQELTFAELVEISDAIEDVAMRLSAAFDALRAIAS